MIVAADVAITVCNKDCLKVNVCFFQVVSLILRRIAGGGLKKQEKKMLPLLNPVLSTSELEEEDDELPRIFFRDQNDVVKQLYEDEEADVVVIDSREINRTDECDNRAPSISRGVVSSEDKTEKNVNSSNVMKKGRMIGKCMLIIHHFGRMGRD